MNDHWSCSTDESKITDARNTVKCHLKYQPSYYFSTLHTMSHIYRLSARTTFCFKHCPGKETNNTAWWLGARNWVIKHTHILIKLEKLTIPTVLQTSRHYEYSEQISTLLYTTTPTKCTILFYIILQLKYYNFSMLQPSLGHLQGVKINHMNKR